MSLLSKMKVTFFMFPLRIVQLLVSLVILGLSGYVASWYNVDTLTASPTQINFLIFAPLWSIVSLVYLETVPRFLPRLSNPYVAMLIEILNVLFYFAGFVALAVFLNTLLFCRGAVCGAARADTFFAAVQWLLWTSTAFLVGKDVFKMGMRKPARGGAQGPYPKEMKETSAA